MMSATEQQSALLDFIDEYTRRNGISPSYAEMSRGMGLRSKSGIHRMVRALEERGRIRTLRARARAIEVLRPNFLEAVRDFVPERAPVPLRVVTYRIPPDVEVPVAGQRKPVKVPGFLLQGSEGPYSGAFARYDIDGHNGKEIALRAGDLLVYDRNNRLVAMVRTYEKPAAVG